MELFGYPVLLEKLCCLAMYMMQRKKPVDKCDTLSEWSYMKYRDMICDEYSRKLCASYDGTRIVNTHREHNIKQTT